MYFAKVPVKKAFEEAGLARMTAAEKFWYVLMCIAFAAGYFAKLPVKRALAEIAPGPAAADEYGYQSGHGEHPGYEQYDQQSPGDELQTPGRQLSADVPQGLPQGRHQARHGSNRSQD
jgi:hypothetical protein